MTKRISNVNFANTDRLNGHTIKTHKKLFSKYRKNTNKLQREILVLSLFFVVLCCVVIVTLRVAILFTNLLLLVLSLKILGHSHFQPCGEVLISIGVQISIGTLYYEIANPP